MAAGIVQVLTPSGAQGREVAAALRAAGLPVLDLAEVRARLAGEGPAPGWTPEAVRAAVGPGPAVLVDTAWPLFESYRALRGYIAPLSAAFSVAPAAAEVGRLFRADYLLALGRIEAAAPALEGLAAAGAGPDEISLTGWWRFGVHFGVCTLLHQYKRALEAFAGEHRERGVPAGDTPGALAWARRRLGGAPGGGAGGGWAEEAPAPPPERDWAEGAPAPPPERDWAEGGPGADRGGGAPFGGAPERGAPPAPERQLVVQLGGAATAGKSWAARELQRRCPGALVYDDDHLRAAQLARCDERAVIGGWRAWTELLAAERTRMLRGLVAAARGRPIILAGGPVQNGLFAAAPGARRVLVTLEPPPEAAPAYRRMVRRQLKQISRNFGMIRAVVETAPIGMISDIIDAQLWLPYQGNPCCPPAAFAASLAATSKRVRFDTGDSDESLHLSQGEAVEQVVRMVAAARGGAPPGPAEGGAPPGPAEDLPARALAAVDALVAHQEWIRQRIRDAPSEEEFGREFAARLGGPLTPRLRHWVQGGGARGRPGSEPIPLSPAGPVLWITGRPGVGKTWLGREVARRRPDAAVFDLDDLRSAAALRLATPDRPVPCWRAVGAAATAAVRGAVASAGKAPVVLVGTGVKVELGGGAALRRAVIWFGPPSAEQDRVLRLFYRRLMRRELEKIVANAEALRALIRRAPPQYLYDAVGTLFNLAEPVGMPFAEYQARVGRGVAEALAEGALALTAQEILDRLDALLGAPGPGPPPAAKAGGRGRKGRAPPGAAGPAGPPTTGALYREYKRTRPRARRGPVPPGAPLVAGRVAVVVPFRDNPAQNRAAQLAQFLAFWGGVNAGRRFPGADVFVVEQSPGARFNRGLLLNVGFLVAREAPDAPPGGYESFVFSDVDTLPDAAALRNFFVRPARPVHLSSDRVFDRRLYPEYLGGVVAFSREDFERVGGFPNSFFGWGAEDDALYDRVAGRGLAIWDAAEGRMESMPHEDSRLDPAAVNPRRWEAVLGAFAADRADAAAGRPARDGLAAAPAALAAPRRVEGAPPLVRVFVDPAPPPP